jgi:hypothetical protein
VVPFVNVKNVLSPPALNDLWSGPLPFLPSCFVHFFLALGFVSLLVFSSAADFDSTAAARLSYTPYLIQIFF